MPRSRCRSAPGAGRPAKLYERSGHEVAVSVPPRDYGVAARLLADTAAKDEVVELRRRDLVMDHGAPFERRSI